jgi:hypothetical protein
MMSNWVMTALSAPKPASPSVVEDKTGEHGAWYFHVAPAVAPIPHLGDDWLVWVDVMWKTT